MGKQAPSSISRPAPYIKGKRQNGNQCTPSPAPESPTLLPLSIKAPVNVSIGLQRFSFNCKTNIVKRAPVPFRSESEYKELKIKLLEEKNAMLERNYLLVTAELALYKADFVPIDMNALCDNMKRTLRSLVETAIRMPRGNNALYAAFSQGHFCKPVFGPEASGNQLGNHLVWIDSRTKLVNRGRHLLSYNQDLLAFVMSSRVPAGTQKLLNAILKFDALLRNGGGRTARHRICHDASHVSHVEQFLQSLLPDGDPQIVIGLMFRENGKLMVPGESGDLIKAGPLRHSV